MKKLLLLLTILWCTPVWAQNPTCPTRPDGDSSNACASTAFTQQAIALSVVVSATPPRGRLTLTSGVPVMKTSVAAATTIYYAPYNGNTVPINAGGTVFQRQFTSSLTDQIGLSAALGSNWTTATNFSWFVAWDTGTPRLCSGPGWASNTTLPSGVGTAETEAWSSIGLTNKFSMTCRYSNAATITCAAHECTYVGVTTIGNAGQISYIFGTNAAGGGVANFLVWNMYNRVPVETFVGNTNTSWNTSASANTWQLAGGLTVEIGFVRGQDEDGARFLYTAHCLAGAASQIGISVAVDNFAVPGPTANIAMNPTTAALPLSAEYNGLPGVGLHTAGAIDASSSTTVGQCFGNAALTMLLTGLHGTLWQ